MQFIANYIDILSSRGVFMENAVARQRLEAPVVETPIWSSLSLTYSTKSLLILIPEVNPQCLH